MSRINKSVQLSRGVILGVVIILCCIPLPSLRAAYSATLQDSLPKELYQEAVRLFQAGGFAQAEAKLREALHEQPQFPEAVYLLALVFAATERVEDAEKFVQQALVQKPDFGEAWHLLGRLYTAKNQPDLAKKEFDLFSSLEKAEMEEQRQVK